MIHLHFLDKKGDCLIKVISDILLVIKEWSVVALVQNAACVQQDTAVGATKLQLNKDLIFLMSVYRAGCSLAICCRTLHICQPLLCSQLVTNVWNCSCNLCPSLGLCTDTHPVSLPCSTACSCADNLAEWGILQRGAACSVVCPGAAAGLLTAAEPWLVLSRIL